MMAWTWFGFLFLCFAGVWSTSTVAHSCKWDGRFFNAQENILDLSSTCTTQFGSASGFSMAFTLAVSSFSNQGIIDFGQAIGVGGVRVTALSTGHLQWSIFDDGGDAFHVSSGPVADLTHRWLMTIDSNGHMEIYKDGVKDGEGDSGKSMTTVSRTLKVGGLLDGSSIFQEGRNEDLFLFNQLVDWASAVVPEPSTVCKWDGQVFSGQVVYPTGCPAWSGGSFSVAVTARVDAYSSAWPFIFEFNQYTHITNSIGLLVNAQQGEVVYFGTWSSARAAGQERHWMSQPAPVGATRRYLAVAASNGYMQLFIDGELSAEGYATPFVPSDSQSFIIGGIKEYTTHRFLGLIEDFYVFYDKVGWDSAVVPPVEPDCTYAGAEFDGTFNVDLTTMCSSTFGGGFSFAFLARVDSAGPAHILYFNEAANADAAVVTAYLTPEGKVECWYGSHGISTASSVVGLTQRYMCSFAATGYMQMFVDGIQVAEANGGVITSATRLMTLGSRHDAVGYFDGLIEDLYIFHSKIGWNSATTSTTTTTSTTPTTSTTTISITTTSSTTTSTTKTSSTTTSSTMTTSSTTSTTSSSTATSSTSTSSTSTSTSTNTTSTTSSTSTTSTATTTSSTTSTTSTTSSTSTTSTTTTTSSSTSTTSTTSSASTTSTTTTTSSTTSTTFTTSSTSTTSTTTTTSSSTSTTSTTSSTSTTSTTTTSTSTTSTTSTTTSTSTSTTSTSTWSTTTSTSNTSTTSSSSSTSATSTTSSTSTSSASTSTSSSSTNSTTTTSSTTTTVTTITSGTSGTWTSSSTTSTTSGSASTSTTSSTSTNSTSTTSGSTSTSVSSTLTMRSTSRSTTSLNTPTTTTTSGTVTATLTLTLPSSFSSTQTGVPSQNPVPSVKIMVGIDGVDYAMLADDASARSAFVFSFEQGVLDVLSSTSASMITSSDMSTQLLPAGRLLGARALQAAGIQVETTIMSSAPEELLSTLQDAAEGLTTAIKGRIEATMQSTVQISSLVVSLVQAGASATTSSTTTMSVKVVEPVSTPGPKIEEQVTQFVGKVTAGLSSVAARLTESNQTAITEAIPGGIVTSTKLGSLFAPAVDNNETSSERVVLDIPEADVSISIPLSFRDILPPNVAPENVVIGVGVIDPTSEESGLSSFASKPDEDGTPVSVEAVMVIEFLGPDGTPLNISGLLEPIEFSMQANYSLRSNCAFWDEDLQQWSDKGVSESPKNQVGENIVCLTEHLSLFGALLRGIASAILCSQMSLLNPEGIGNLLQGDWHIQAGAVFYWWTLAVSFAMLSIGTVIDVCRARHGQTWSAEFFLCVKEQERGLRKEESLDDDPSEGSAEEPHQGFICWAVCCCLSCVATVCACLKENAARDALDEIMSEWFEQFSEVRSCIEGCWEGLEIASLSAGRLFQLSHSVMCQVTLSSSRRLAGASLRLSDEVVAFVLGDEDLQDLLMNKYFKGERDTANTAGEASTPGEASKRSAAYTLSGGSATAGPRPRWWTCPHHEEAWFLLHAEVSDSVQRHINNHSLCNLPRMVLHIFLMHNPIGLVFCHDIFFSCKLRSFFHALEIHGSLMVSAVFFAASGRRGRLTGEEEEDEPDECDPEEEDILFYIGKALVVAFGSVLLSGLPVMFLQSLHTRSFKTFDCADSPEWRRQLRAWFLQDALIWTFGSLYLCFCTFFVCVFLANVPNEDHEEFAQTALLCIIQNTIVMPLVVAIFVPSIAGVLLLINGAASGGGREHLLRDVHCTLHAQTNVMLPIVTV